MKIEAIKVQNFKSLKDIELTSLSELCIFVGAKGSGKTTIFDIFGFLRDCLTYNVTRAMQSRGGYQELIARGQQNQDILIELKFRIEITGVERLVT